MAKRKATNPKRDVDNSLTLSDRFYIENNPNLSIEELSKQINKPEEIIISYCNTLIKKEKGNRVRKLFNTPVPGVTVMTEAASEAGDHAISTSQLSILQRINQALATGNVTEAQRLKEEHINQQNDTLLKAPRYNDCIHVINP